MRWLHWALSYIFSMTHVVFFLVAQVRTSLMAFPPAWIKYAGILSTPADFLIFSVFTAATISSRRIGLVSVGNQVP